MISSRIDQAIANFIFNNDCVVSLLVKIKSGQVTDGQKIREIYRKQWKGLKNFSELIFAIKELSKINICFIEEIRPPIGRPYLIIRINNEEL
jgi:hypothetical protein